VVRKGEGSTTLFAPPASTEHAPTHLSTGAFSAPRMRTARGPSRTWCCLHRTMSISDTLVVALRHARVGLQNRPMRWPVLPACLRRTVRTLTCEPEDPDFTPPVRARWARARECLPSSREPTSRNPLADYTRTFYRQRVFAYRFAFSPLVPRVRNSFPRLSSFLPASALPCFSSRGLATSRRARRAMRPIDFCHPNETACTRTSYVPGYLPRLSPRGRLPEFGLRAA